MKVSGMWAVGAVIGLSTVVAAADTSPAAPALGAANTVAQSTYQGTTNPGSGTVTPLAGQLPVSFYGGVIEGYYGAPWSIPDTIHMIQFIGAHHMNTFVYAPKDDPYQRAKWNHLYPAAELQTLRQLVQACEQSHVQFVYSISPGLSITYSSAADRKALAAKLDQLRGIGVHVFMLSLDDIYHGLEGADRPYYHGDMAWAQSALANFLIQSERSADPSFRLLLTPTHYHGVKNSTYWDSLRVHLDKSVPVIWTGPGPGALSARISAAQVKTVEKFIGHPIIIWDNYPVNDYTYTQSHHPRLFLGPVIGRGTDLVAAVTGYLFNPMIQARPSEVALWTGGDYLIAPQSYHPQASWQAAIQGLGGSARAAFATFVADSASYYRDTSPPTALAVDMASFWRLGKSANLIRTPLYRDWVRLLPVDANLRTGLPDRQLYAEIQPWSHLLSEQGQLGVLAVQMLQAYRQHKPFKALVVQVQARLASVRRNPDVIAGDAAATFAARALADLHK